MFSQTQVRDVQVSSSKIKFRGISVSSLFISVSSQGPILIDSGDINCGNVYRIIVIC